MIFLPLPLPPTHHTYLSLKYPKVPLYLYYEIGVFVFQYFRYVMIDLNLNITELQNCCNSSVHPVS